MESRPDGADDKHNVVPEATGWFGGLSFDDSEPCNLVQGLKGAAAAATTTTTKHCLLRSLATERLGPLHAAVVGLSSK